MSRAQADRDVGAIPTYHYPMYEIEIAICTGIAIFWILVVSNYYRQDIPDDPEENIRSITHYRREKVSDNTTIHLSSVHVDTPYWDSSSAMVCDPGCSCCDAGCSCGDCSSCT